MVELGVQFLYPSGEAEDDEHLGQERKGHHGANPSSKRDRDSRAGGSIREGKF